MLDLIKKSLGIPRYKLGGHRPDPGYDFVPYSASIFNGSERLLPGGADLRPFSSPRHDQGRTGSCVAQAVIKALEIKRIMKYGHDKHVDLSVLDLYYGARDKMSPKETNYDGGTYISLACQVLKEYGVCRESAHPFKSENLYIPPPILATREARLNRIKAAYKIKSYGEDLLTDVILNLEMGNPVVFGTTVGNNWMYNTGQVIGITPENEVKGRHAVCIVGFMNDLFIIENSWGKNWGDNGYGYLKPEVLTDLESKDFWVICEGSEAWYEKE